MYFEERFNEKKEDPLKDKITFTFPWILTRQQLHRNNETDFIDVQEIFRTKYKFLSAKWAPFLLRNEGSTTLYGSINFEDPIRVWNGTCICSYNLYSDTEGRILLYSSPRTEMRNSETFDDFQSPAGFMTELDEAITEKKLKKLVVFFELQLPAKHFYRPFEMPSCELSRMVREKYPEDMDNGFESEFMNDSDFVFKCPDGEMPAMRIVLNNASEYMHEHFNSFPNSNELVVYHSIDVIKPLITCFHTRCFKMPKSFILDYAKRLLMAKDFFKPDIQYSIETSIHQSLCQKFVEEKHTFNSILQWLKIACQHYFLELGNMILTVISDKFYYEWCGTFPENARNEENPIFRDIFGRNSLQALGVFTEVDEIMTNSLLMNVILD